MGIILVMVKFFQYSIKFIDLLVMSNLMVKKIKPTSLVINQAKMDG
ncbi:hypothetical protein RintRC_6119 [Richelia intracellularis]|nr:hypothetical protein RintRC_6119 [Richelia intracellularis]